MDFEPFLVLKIEKRPNEQQAPDKRKDADASWRRKPRRVEDEKLRHRNAEEDERRNAKCARASTDAQPDSRESRERPCEGEASASD